MFLFIVRFSIINRKMNIDSWKIYYKNNCQTTQMVYEPRISPNNKIFCMNFAYGSEYQLNQQKNYPEKYTPEFVNFMFERELNFLNLCKNESWCPEILDIDFTKQRIYLKNGRNINDLDQSQYISNVSKIIKEQWEIGIVKLTVYPHSHMLQEDGTITAIDFYASTTVEDPMIDVEKVLPLMGNSEFRFREVQQGQQINLIEMFKSTLLNHSRWPGNLVQVHGDLFG